jgi:hypothetical protein
MKHKITGIISILMVIILGGCNLPRNDSPVPAETFTPIPPPIVDTPSSTIAPVVLTTDTASPTSKPQDPLVLRDTLCYVGPGPKYDVVSALNQGEQVKLLGVGSVSGWYVVENPTYHDPCWVASNDLQIDAGTDLVNLKTFTPPPLPSPTKPPTPIPSATPV